MEITDYHARLFATELMCRCASDDAEKLATVLADARVEASLFAFRTPLTKGAVLAGEVGHLRPDPRHRRPPILARRLPRLRLPRQRPSKTKAAKIFATKGVEVFKTV